MTVRWADDHILTEEDIAWISAQGACGGERRYLGWTVAMAAKAAPWAALEFCADRLSDAQFDRAAKAAPWVALEFCAARLSDAQFDRAANAALRAALEFCADRYRQFFERNA